MNAKSSSLLTYKVTEKRHRYEKEKQSHCYETVYLDRKRQLTSVRLTWAGQKHTHKQLTIFDTSQEEKQTNRNLGQDLLSF